MCGLTGALLRQQFDPVRATRLLNHLYHNSHQRGRDGRGWSIHFKNRGYTELHSTTRLESPDGLSAVMLDAEVCSMISNTRAEPTTEYVQNKELNDQQPYRVDQWCIVHNGTIANDRWLRTNRVATRIDSAAIVESLAATKASNLIDFSRVAMGLVGSYAIIAQHREEPGALYTATNYRPLWMVETEDGVFFGSSRHMFPSDLRPTMLAPYTAHRFSFAFFDDQLHDESVELLPPPDAGRALVVCSGGLDSTVAAAWAIKQGYEVQLLHFDYGCNAGSKEGQAILDVAEALGVEVYGQQVTNLWRPSHSNLLNRNARIAGGEEGAEFAHEWVPARNLVMLALATAIAEGEGFGTLVLGNNMEEAGSYPDNEPEFIDRFNDLLPFAVRANKSVRVIMPVGNLMKHEIVKLGLELKAPLDKTWSCYRGGELHCGTCGPCYMRKRAFEINGADEVIQYASS